MIPQNFPSETEIKRITTLKKYDDIEDNKQFSALGLHPLVRKHLSDSDLIYISHAIPSKVSEFYADFVSGEEDKLQFIVGDDKQQELVDHIVDFNDLVEKIYDFAYDQSEFSFVVLLGRVEDDEFIIDAVPQDQYFPQRDGSVIFASYVVKPNATDPTTDVWLYTQHYRIENGHVVIERELHDTLVGSLKGSKVELSKYDTSLLPREEIKELAYLPIVQIDNGRKRGTGFGKSDYEDILSNLSEINERVSQIAIQFLKALNAKMILPASMKNQEGGVNPFEYVMIDDNSQMRIQPQYLSLNNPLINEAYTHIEKQINMISFVTSVPAFELTGNTQPERVESLRIKLFSAVRKTTRKRMKMKNGLDWLIRIGLMMKGIAEPEKITIKFGDVLPEDALTEANIEELKLRNGLISKRSAMKKLDGMTDEQVDAEIEEMNGENAVAGVFPQNNPPQI